MSSWSDNEDSSGEESRSFGKRPQPIEKFTGSKLSPSPPPYSSGRESRTARLQQDDWYGLHPKTPGNPRLQSSSTSSYKSRSIPPPPPISGFKKPYLEPPLLPPSDTFKGSPSPSKERDTRIRALVREPLLSKRETEARILYWREKALKGGFDADIHIADPLAHLAHLDYTEELVVTCSEYFRSGGIYDCNDDRLPDLRMTENWHSNMTDSLRYRTPEDIGTYYPTETSIPWMQSRETLKGLWKSYIILCRTLRIFEKLRVNRFCENFYSMLVKQASRDEAKLVRLNLAELEGLKTGIENAITKIFDRDSEDGPEFVLASFVSTQCDLLLTNMGLYPDSIRQLRLPIITVCRITVVLLDLALVSYVGSHGCQFPSYVESTADTVSIWSSTPVLPGFRCSLRHLACLDSFLDESQVWVFSNDSEQQRGSRQKGRARGLSVLTRMEEFADIWGPVWTVRSSDARKVVQYNLSRGFIRPVVNPRSEGHGINCHWYATSVATDTQPALLMDLNDWLSIGGALVENEDCVYTRQHYENDFGQVMGHLGTIPDTWQRDAFALGFSAGYFVNLTASGTFKRLPGTNLKQNIWNKLGMSPKTANPEYLNHFVGLEVSHCSGNARRIQLKDIFTLESVRKRLSQKYPGWETTVWGEQFLNALRLKDDREIHTVWTRFRDDREEMGKLITSVLQDLHLTGIFGDTLVAAYFGEVADRHIEIRSLGNEWATCLRDSVGVATYAVIGDSCLKYRRDIDAPCGRGRTKTFLETQILFQQEPPSENVYIKLEPHKTVFKVQKISRNNCIKLNPVAGEAAARFLVPVRQSAREIVARFGIGGNQKEFAALIRATTDSNRGMAMTMPRQRVQRAAGPQVPAPDPLDGVEAEGPIRGPANRQRRDNGRVQVRANGERVGRRPQARAKPKAKRKAEPSCGCSIL